MQQQQNTLQELQKTLLEILTIIEYTEDKHAYVKKFIALFESQAFMNCLANLSKEQQEAIAKRTGQLEITEKIHALKDYLSPSLLQEKLVQASQEQFETFFTSVAPTLRDDQLEKLHTFFLSLREYKVI